MAATVEFDLANERVVIASMIKSAEARKHLSFALKPTDFGDPKHRITFSALTQMHRRNLDWSEDTFADLAGKNDFGGFKYLRQVIAEYQPNSNLDHHVSRLRLDSAKFFASSEDLPALAELCQKPTAPLEEAVQLSRALLARFENLGGVGVWSGNALIDDWYQTLKVRRAVGAVKEELGLGEILERSLPRGLVVGRVSIIAGRPGMGKTTLVSNVIRARALRMNKGTFICGWEMDREDYMDMITSSETGIPSERLSIKADELTKDEMRAIYRVGERLRDDRLLEIEEYPFADLERPKSKWDYNDRNLDYFESTVQRAARTKQLIVVDTIGKLFHKRDPDSITEGLYRIETIAKRYHVHICLLHHINRTGAEGAPKLEHLKGSGAFEEIADVVIGLDRPILRASPAKRRKMVDHLDVHVLKQRKGPAPLCIRYRFDGPRFRISDEVEVDLSLLEEDEEDEV